MEWKYIAFSLSICLCYVYFALAKLVSEAMTLLLKNHKVDFSHTGWGLYCTLVVECTAHMLCMEPSPAKSSQVENAKYDFTRRPWIAAASQNTQYWARWFSGGNQHMAVQ